MIDGAEFQTRAEDLRNKLLAALLLQGHMIAYDGVLDGMDVVIIGYITDPEHPTAEVKPLAIEISPEVFARLEVNATRIFQGEEI